MPGTRLGAAVLSPALDSRHLRDQQQTETLDTGRSRHAQRDQTKVHGTPVHAWRRYEVQVRAHSMPGVIVYPAEEAALD